MNREKETKINFIPLTDEPSATQRGFLDDQIAGCRS